MPALPELAQFVVPLIQGSVHQIHDLQLVTATADYSGSLTLIARRSSQRPGVRHWRRGAATDVSAPNNCVPRVLGNRAAEGDLGVSNLNMPTPWTMHVGHSAIASMITVAAVV